MGWFGYGIYDGDETQTRHINFLIKAKVMKKEEAICRLRINGTVLFPFELRTLKKNINKLKMPKKIESEDSALEWQMLLSLFIDNEVKPNKTVFNNGLKATQYLIHYCCDDFNNPYARKKELKTFIKKCNNYDK